MNLLILTLALMYQNSEDPDYKQLATMCSNNFIPFHFLGILGAEEDDSGIFVFWCVCSTKKYVELSSLVNFELFLFLSSHPY